MFRKFKPGDWVSIKGEETSPQMKVLKYVSKKLPFSQKSYADTLVECVWYNQAKRHLGVFNQNQLIKILNGGGLFKA